MNATRPADLVALLSFGVLIARSPATVGDDGGAGGSNAGGGTTSAGGAMATSGGGTASAGGGAMSIGGVNVVVDHYTSSRPDGLLDILPCDGMTLSNITGTFDSSFLNDVDPGTRFPSAPYTRLTMQNVTLTDLAAHTHHAPVSLANNLRSSTFSAFVVHVNDWDAGEIAPPFNPLDGGNDLHVDFTQTVEGSYEATAQTSGVTTRLTAAPVSVQTGSMATLKWSSVNATTCVASGGWSGTLAVSGSMLQPIATAGDHPFTLTCTGLSGSSTVTLHVTGM